MLKICHISDTQIRTFHRHWEFEESYEHLYASIKKQNPDYIVFAGDLAHTKTHISPELVGMIAKYLKNLADIAPLILVPGNHDGNLNNLARQDTLTPIVEALDHPNIYYYKHSGVYVHHDVSFVVFSCFDENWPTGSSILRDEEIPIVGVYHGMVKGAILQNGIEVIDCQYDLKDFLDIVDFLMMGDIHRMQILDFHYRAAYCGSFPQQNFGESTTKGYLVWDIRSKEDHDVDFIELPNVCPFYTIDLPDDLTIPDLKLQKNARIRVRSRQLRTFEKQSIEDKVKLLYEPLEIYWKDEINAHRQELKIGEGTTIEDLRTLGVQEKLIADFLKPYNLKKDVLERIFQINKKCDSATAKNEEVVRGVEYKLKRMKWSNIFSYGENNEFDFSAHKGIIGVFGKNGTGKSSVAVDIPLYLGWNTNSKGVTKNDEIINDEKDMCYGELEIGIGGKTYRIQRSTHIFEKAGKRKGAPVFQGKTDLSLDILHEDGTVESMDGEERRVTDELIRRTFGTAEDFLATSVAPQWKLLNFIDKGGTERQKIIGKYFDVDIFLRKHKLAKEDIKDMKASLKLFDSRSFDKDRSDLVERIERWNKIEQETQSKLKEHKSSITKIDKKIETRLRKIIDVDFDDSITEDTLKDKVMQAKIKCLDKKNEVDSFQNQLPGLVTLSTHSNLSELNSKLTELKDNFSKARNWSQDLAVCGQNLIAAEDRLSLLDKYDCATNPGCCMREERSARLEEVDKLQKDQIKIMSLNPSFSMADLTKEISKYEELINFHNKDTALLERTKYKIESESKILQFMVGEVKRLKETQARFTKNKKQVIINSGLRQEIKQLKDDRYIPNSSIEESEIALRNAGIKVVTLEKELESINNDEFRFNELKSEYEAADYYIQAMSKDGISKSIIGQNLGLINAEMDRILSNKVNFSIELKTDEKGKEIEVYFRHGTSRPRRIELCSGMEKTIAAIAIRAAMISVTTLPKANVFVLDEVFASLDPEYIDAMRKILEHLKSMFDTVMIITHIDGFKDMVDHVVSIERDDKGYSRILN